MFNTLGPKSDRVSNTLSTQGVKSIILANTTLYLGFREGKISFFVLTRSRLNTTYYTEPIKYSTSASHSF